MSGSTQTGSQGLNSGGSPSRFWSATAVRWVLPIVFVGAALILSKILDRYWHSTPFTSLFICVILISAWAGGFGPGLLAVMLSVLAFDYFFLSPIFSLAVDWNAMPRLILFAVSALMVSFIAASQRRTTMSFRQARDDLAVKVQELERINDALHVENAERKLAEDALRWSESYLAGAQRLSQASGLGWRVSTGEFSWSEETFRIFQYAAESKP